MEWRKEIVLLFETSFSISYWLHNKNCSCSLNAPWISELSRAAAASPHPTAQALSIVLKSCFLAFKRCMLKAEKCFSCVTQLSKQLRALNVSAYNNPLQLSCFMVFVFIFTCFCFFMLAFVFSHENLKRCLTNAAILRIQRTTQNYKMKLKGAQDICIFLQLCYPETFGSNFKP